MTLPLFRKSLLAFAIAASQPLLAETIQLSGQPVELSSRLHPGDLILQGQAAGEAYAVALRPFPWTYFGSLVNQASLDASGDGSRALTLSGRGLHPVLIGRMLGNLSNDGRIAAAGDSASGIYVGDAAVLGGDLDNSGEIEASGTGSAGIRLNNFVRISHDLENHGAIKASGTGAAGISLSNTAFISDSLINSGDIRADGSGAMGITLSEANIGGDAQNAGTINVVGESGIGVRLGHRTYFGAFSNLDSGVIRVTGDDSRGLSFESDSDGMVMFNAGTILVEGSNSTAVYAANPYTAYWQVNMGSIQARGADSRAIFLGDEEPSTPPIFNSHQVVFNLGEIISDGVAIDIAESADDAHGAFIEQWSGLIEGGTAAIRAHDNATLSLSGGEIRGDLIGLRHMAARGDVLFSGNLIEARQLAIRSLELGSAHVRLKGDLDLGNGGTLDLNLHPQTEPTRAILDISGRAVLGWDSQIRLKPASEDFQGLPLRRFVLLSADQIEDTAAAEDHGLFVTSQSDLLQIRDYQITDTQITATVSSLSTDQVGDYLLAHGARSHVLPAFTAFYGSVLGSLDEQDPLFQAVVSSNDQRLVNLAQQLAPEVNGAAYRTLVDNQHLIASALQARSASLRHQPSFEPRETGAWVQVLNSDVDQGQRSGIPGYDADSDGIAVGADGQLDPNTRLGVAYSYLTSDVRSQGGNKTDIQGHGLSLYGSYERDAWFVDAGVTFGRYDNEGKRHIAGTTAKGDYDSDVWGVDLLGGYGLQLSQQVLLEPRVAARYSNVRIDSYSERGSAAALAVGSQRYEVGQLGAGIRLAGNLEAGQGWLEPEAILMAYHDFIADQVSSTSSFVAGGGTFVTQGTRPPRDSYQATLGMAYRLGSMKVGLGYDYLSGADYSSDTLSGRVSYEF